MSSALVTFDEIWEKEFLPAVRARRQRTGERRSEAFLETPLTVCGEEIRQMNAEDLLMFDGFESPFVVGGDIEPIFSDLEFFLWQLHTENDHSDGFGNAWRRGRFLRRIRRLDPVEAIAEVREYCARMFADFAGESSREVDRTEAALRPEPPTHFLAPLLVSVAREIGHLDPMSGRLLAHIPLPRLVQYRKAAAPDPDESDDLAALRNQCMDRVNHLNAAARGVSISIGNS